MAVRQAAGDSAVPRVRKPGICLKVPIISLNLLVVYNEIRIGLEFKPLIEII